MSGPDKCYPEKTREENRTVSGGAIEYSGRAVWGWSLLTIDEIALTALPHAEMGTASNYAGDFLSNHPLL